MTSPRCHRQYRRGGDVASAVSFANFFASRQSLLKLGTDRVDPLRCERLNLTSVYKDSFCLCINYKFDIVYINFLIFFATNLLRGNKPGQLFCGDIDGVPLGQRGVLPGPTQINLRVPSRGTGSARTRTHAAGSKRRTNPNRCTIYTDPFLP